jgi:23S rRNA (uracil747-C5)-methyltransferase
VDCSYFLAGTCRSCRWLEVAYPDQLVAKQERVRAALPPMPWEPPVSSGEAGFRNKAKMVVAGSVDSPTLGILDPAGHGVDLQECPLHDPRLVAALPPLARFVRLAGLVPYSVPERRGELKHLLVTVSPAGELMVRWVLRSSESLGRIRKHLPSLMAELPIAVASVNVQPAHAAVLEGREETVLTPSDSMVMAVNGLPLHLRPQSFFQTNTEVAARLYREAASLVDSVGPRSVWDLYCGVGGFALHVAAPGRVVWGVETSAQAIESARLSASELGLDVSFVTGDATVLAAERGGAPELVILNPPRRGIGSLASWLESQPDVRHVVYSSCNAGSLAKDLAAMPSYSPISARLLDMFPHTDHHKVLVLLSRG